MPEYEIEVWQVLDLCVPKLTQTSFFVHILPVLKNLIDSAEEVNCFEAKTYLQQAVASGLCCHTQRLTRKPSH